MRRIRQSLSVASLDPIPAGTAGFSDKVTTTPLVVQDGFGYGGVKLPADGLAYCGPTAMTMSLLWLGKNGWSQIGPAAPKKEDALHLDRILGGLAGTSALGGTYTTSLQNGVGDYLNARGIPASAFSWSLTNGPTISDIAGLNKQQTVVTLLIGWYTLLSGNAYQWIGGHFVAILGQHVETGSLTIGNPCPSALKTVPDKPEHARQTLTTSPFTGTGQYLDQSLSYVQFPNITWPGSLQVVTPVLLTVIALTVETSQRSSPAPSAWILAAPQTIDTNEADFTILAPVGGAGGLAQAGEGALTLAGSNTTSGPNTISGGSLGGPGATTPSGSVTIANGRLVLNPGGAGAEASLALPGGLCFSGAAELELVVGKNDGLAVSLGEEDGASGITWEQTGTLTIIVDKGVAELGQSCLLTAPGGIGALQVSPISPSMVAKSLGIDDGDFLSYGSSAGFVLPSYTSSTSTNINDASASDVYLVDDDQTLKANANVTVYALKVAGRKINAGESAMLTIAAANNRAGLILTAATLSGFQLNFGASNAAIYIAGRSQVSAVIAGSGRLTVSGPGALSLSGGNTCSGEILVQSGTLEVAAGSGTGSGSVWVQGTGTLSLVGTGSVSGEVQAQQGGTIALAGGTAAGGVSVDDQSILSGSGLIQGVSTTISGQIVAGSSPGVITFDGAATLEPQTLFVWTLFYIDDTYQGNSLAFNNAGGSEIGQSGEPIIVLLDMTQLGDEYGPNNTSNIFWQGSQIWTLVEGNTGFGWVDVSVLQPQFKTGYFSISYNSNFSAVYLNFTPQVV